MAEGRSGYTATRADWLNHINSLFPEARLKNTLEVRGADAQPNDLVCAVPALWKGLLYDEEALSRAEGLIGNLDAQRLQAARTDIATHGLRAQLLGRTLQQWAMEVLGIAADGLAQLATANASGKAERVHLERLASIVESGDTPADLLLREVGRPNTEGFAQRVVQAAQI